MRSRAERRERAYHSGYRAGQWLAAFLFTVLIAALAVGVLTVVFSPR